MRSYLFIRVLFLLFNVLFLSQCGRQEALPAKNDTAESDQIAISEILQRNRKESIPANRNTAERTHIEISEVLPDEKTGFINGDACYPSDGIPSDMKIFAENLATNKTYMVPLTDINDASIFTGQTKYAIRVPGGSYYVYAMTMHMQHLVDYKAYYSEYVKCGQTVKCRSHVPIKVSVSANETMRNIDPCDWYDRSRIRGWEDRYKLQQFLEQQRLQMARENEEIDRTNQRWAKLRLILYVISATSIFLVLILLIVKRIRNRNIGRN